MTYISKKRTFSKPNENITFESITQSIKLSSVFFLLLCLGGGRLLSGWMGCDWSIEGRAALGGV